MTSTDHDSLRLNMYYDMQKEIDELYLRSNNDENFVKLYDLIISDKNIKMALQTIRSNAGSKTKGTDGKNIFNFLNKTETELIESVKEKLNDYKPDSVRRVLIPKPGSDKKRPLGIPTFGDRLIQQCFKQILEPILEAKFHDDSYGFRPLRSCSHAISRFQNLVNRAQLHYVVDIDIKGFFDNINHGKLLKQLYTLGIRDKKVLAIISKMLKAEIEGEGIPTKGTPQGGILSPLLANVVLNELDWWLSSQWLTSKKDERLRNPKGQANFIQKMKRKLKNGEIKRKEFYFVRYADDFKIFCRNKETAQRIYEGTKAWLRDRLELEVNEEKSKITNLRKQSSEFLGFSLTTRPKKVKKRDWVTANKYNNIETMEYYCISYISNKSLESISLKVKEGIKRLQKDQSHKNVDIFNSTIRGIHNYYKIASHVVKGFSKIHYLKWNLKTRLKNNLAKVNMKNMNADFREKYGKYNGPLYAIGGVNLIPLDAVWTEKPMAFPKKRCLYTKEGRSLINYSKEKVIQQGLQHLIRYPLRNESIELNLNRQSKYSQQRGKCILSGELLALNNFDVHHIKPRSLGGTDEYKNLVLLNRKYHRLVHSKNVDEIMNILSSSNLNAVQMDRLNQYRLEAGNIEI